MRLRDPDTVAGADVGVVTFRSGDTLVIEGPVGSESARWSMHLNAQEVELSPRLDRVAQLVAVVADLGCVLTVLMGELSGPAQELAADARARCVTAINDARLD